MATDDPAAGDSIYRDPLPALRERACALEAELTALRAGRRLRAALERELEQLRAVLYRRSLPALDRVRVATPCDTAWADMIGDDRVRSCARCDKPVFNLSAMTRLEAEAFVRAQTGSYCVTFYRRADGTIMTSDCGLAIQHLTLLSATLGLGSLVLLAAMIAWILGDPTAPRSLDELKREHVIERTTGTVPGRGLPDNSKPDQGL